MYENVFLMSLCGSILTRVKSGRSQMPQDHFPVAPDPKKALQR